MLLRIYFFLLFILTNITYAYRCYESRCDDLRFGVGMYYSNFNSINTPNYSNIGGILTGYAGGYWSNRLYAGVDLYGGLGNSTIQGNFIGNADVISNRLHFFYNATLHIGVNANTMKNPLFISLDMPAERQDFYGNREQRLRHISVYLGGSILGRYALREDIDLEYQIGYAHTIFTRFASFYFNDLVFFNGYRIDMGLGVIMRRDYDGVYEKRRKKPDFYAKIRGSYYQADPLEKGGITYHIMDKSFMLMFEFGIGLDATY
ncbi:hypothetical protein CQA53_02670 [Helicobacter didelphidarum]|uniref:Outer membrane beta-barrel protein n=1 Tax=Helicobacter didelphidarum TaxID=2040648 RepID=A0A3D8IP64_9HELI|nr:hypothetical protein [Helicobacter didelphidarum]RDU66696.1 hypothetical protein CQA53_02670 [Helicobacter didelphidarum]